MGDEDLHPPTFHGSAADNSFHCITFQPTAVERHVKKLKPDSATGPDGIPARLLHDFEGLLHSAISSKCL